MNPVQRLAAAIDNIEWHMILAMIKRWRIRYSNERKLEGLERNAGFAGYRAPDLGGEG